MPTVLVTAFRPYAHWDTNASWLALEQLARELPARPSVTTRLYPVDFEEVQRLLTRDLQADFDFALHLGQAPGNAKIRLEQFAINVGGLSTESPDHFRPLVEDGPAAYRSTLPLATWAEKLQAAGIPAHVSHYAGTYLCNAALYFSCHLAATLGLKTQATFLHVPLDPSQAASAGENQAYMPAAMTASAVRLILEELAG
jgi:pyroglutamyl-peptidase